MDTPAARRHRLHCAGAAAAIVVVGLIVHRVDLGLHPVVRDMLGDALWAAMIYCWLGALMPRARWSARTLLALAICGGVEASQLYRSPWLDSVRATWPGHLLLGSGYDSRDLLAYFLGVVVAAGTHRLTSARLPGK